MDYMEASTPAQASWTPQVMTEGEVRRSPSLLDPSLTKEVVL